MADYCKVSFLPVDGSLLSVIDCHLQTGQEEEEPSCLEAPKLLPLYIYIEAHMHGRQARAHTHTVTFTIQAHKTSLTTDYTM